MSRFLRADAAKNKNNLPLTEVVYNGWNNRTAAFCPFWKHWRERIVYGFF